MEKVLINLLNRMFLHCKIPYGDPVRLEAILQHYLNTEFKVLQVGNYLQAVYNDCIIEFELNENNYISNIRASRASNSGD